MQLPDCSGNFVEKGGFSKKSGEGVVSKVGIYGLAASSGKGVPVLSSLTGSASRVCVQDSAGGKRGGGTSGVFLDAGFGSEQRSMKKARRNRWDWEKLESPGDFTQGRLDESNTTPSFQVVDTRFNWPVEGTRTDKNDRGIVNARNGRGWTSPNPERPIRFSSDSKNAFSQFVQDTEGGKRDGAVRGDLRDVDFERVQQSSRKELETQIQRQESTGFVKAGLNLNTAPATAHDEFNTEGKGKHLVNDNISSFSPKQSEDTRTCKTWKVENTVSGRDRWYPLSPSEDNIRKQAVLSLKRKVREEECLDEDSLYTPRRQEEHSVPPSIELHFSSGSHSHASPQGYSKGTWYRDEKSPEMLSSSAPYNAEEERIVWPPVVIIENTRVGWDETTKKWKGLENEEIRRFLKGVKNCEYDKVLALYGVKGHRGKALVIFPHSYLGYMDAQALSECLRRDDKGREQWRRVSHGLHLSSMRGWDAKGLITNDGKRILYGYFAREEDMIDADPNRKVVKRWSMESYSEKVLEPMKRTEQAKEEARKKREELAEEAKHKSLALEHDKSEFGKVVDELRKINEESQRRKKCEEELEDRHRRDIEARKRSYEGERSKKVSQFQQRETDIRSKIQWNKVHTEKEITKFKVLAQQWEYDIDEEKKRHEVRLVEEKQMQAMKQMELESDLQVQMEKKLAELEKKFNEKKLNLQQEHNEQIMKSKKKVEEEREKLLESQLKELETFENEAKVAQDATEQMEEGAEINNECVVCYEEFGSVKKERAHYLTCNHANVCMQCAKDLWTSQKGKKEKPFCPTCKTVQKKRFASLPAKVYM